MREVRRAKHRGRPAGPRLPAAPLQLVCPQGQRRRCAHRVRLRDRTVAVTIEAAPAPAGCSRDGAPVMVLVQGPARQGDAGPRRRLHGQEPVQRGDLHGDGGPRDGLLAPEPASKRGLYPLLGPRLAAGRLRAAALPPARPGARPLARGPAGAPQGGEPLDADHPHLRPRRAAGPGVLPDRGRLRGAHPRGRDVGVCHHPPVAERLPRLAGDLVSPGQRAGHGQALPQHRGAAPHHLCGRGAHALERHLHPHPRPPLPRRPRRAAVCLPAGRAAAHDVGAARSHVAAHDDALVAHGGLLSPRAQQARLPAGLPLLCLHLCGRPVHHVLRARAAREACLWQQIWRRQQGARAAKVQVSAQIRVPYDF
mmetsp:Transcript_1495/g.3856  ORF Transcript_1495/g.3856 Transcript_1495/m.3856 type:complete len:366 (-) Transcript_1495:187-1284(-)